jgi:hypothetical protein
MKLETKIKLATLALFVSFFVWCMWCGKFWRDFRKQRAELNRSFAALPDSDKERVQLDIMAAMINASQSNWTILVVPRTNTLEKP